MRYRPLRGDNGRSLATPRIRKSITTLAPTAIPIPRAWKLRINQYANIDGESRIQTLNPLSSTAFIIKKKLKTVSLEPGRNQIFKRGAMCHRGKYCVK
jgi:hypothetical protein